MKYLSLLILGCLLLGTAPAWAMRPINGIVIAPMTVTSGQTVTLAAANQRTVASPIPGGPDSYADDYYQAVTVNSGGRAIVNSVQYIQTLLVRTGGVLEVGANGAIIIPPDATTPGGSITLEPGATLEVKGGYLFGKDGTPPPVGTPEPAYQLNLSPSAHIILNGTSAQNFNSTIIQGSGPTSPATLPALVGRLTVNNAGGVTLNNNTSISQEFHLVTGTVSSANGNGGLTLLSSASGTAIYDVAAATIGNGTVNFPVTMQRYLDGSRNAGVGYRHLAPPLLFDQVSSLANGSFTPTVNAAYNTAAAPNLVTPFPTIFRYDQSRVGATGSFDQGWLSPSTTTETMAPAFGYTVHTPAGGTISFQGRANNTAGSAQGLSRGTGPDAGWQLLGNPHTTPVDLDLITSSGMERTVYVFKSSGPYAGVYASYLPPAVPGNSGLSLNGGTKVLPTAQGFFMRVAAGNSGASVTFPVASRIISYDVAGSAAVQRTSTTDPRPRLQLSLRDAAQSLTHETLVYFDDAATPAFDASYDAAYLPGPGQQLALRTEAAGQGYAINGQPLLTGADVLLPLHLSAAAAGIYSLNVDALQNLPATYHAYLQDAATSTYTDLATTPSIRLNLAANTDNAGRYALLFSTQARVLATAPATLAALVSLYPNPAHGTATLLLPAALRGTSATQVEILNLLGQVVRRTVQPAAAATLELSLDGLAAGLYTVRAHTAAGTVSRRLTVE
jgi:hypothetical protein